MSYVYFVSLTQPNALYGRNDFYSLEISRPKRIKSLQDLEDLLPLVRKFLRDDLIERAKKEGHESWVPALPANSHDAVTIVSFSLLRREK